MRNISTGELLGGDEEQVAGGVRSLSTRRRL